MTGRIFTVVARILRVVGRIFTVAARILRVAGRIFTVAGRIFAFAGRSAASPARWIDVQELPADVKIRPASVKIRGGTFKIRSAGVGERFLMVATRCNDWRKRAGAKNVRSATANRRSARDCPGKAGEENRPIPRTVFVTKRPRLRLRDQQELLAGPATCRETPTKGEDNHMNPIEKTTSGEDRRMHPPPAPRPAGGSGGA